MDSLRQLVILILAGAVLSEASKRIFEFEECNLDIKLLNEIQSYENVTKLIMNEVKRGDLGETFFHEYTKFIDKFGARPTGSENLEKSIDYMVYLTKVSGLKDVTTEELEVPHWIRISEAAMMLHPRLKNIAVLGSGSSVSTPAKGITAEAIVINSFDVLNDADPRTIDGKIVVFDEPYTTYSETVKYRIRGASKAAKKGASAVLVKSITPFSIYSLHTGQQFYENNTVKIPIATITIEDADLLRRLQNEGKSIVINLVMINRFETKRSRNTLVDIKGSSKPEKLVIVSGHIDSWDVGEGALDNGGGMFISWFVPIVLTVKNLVPKRTVRAILFTAEEPGLIGSKAYLKKHSAELDNINFIMESDEGTFKPLGLDFAGSEKARCIVKEVLKLFEPINQMTKSKHPGSDITQFVRKKIPGASLKTKNERYFWYHHSEGDTLSVQNKDDILECAAFWATFAYVIADLSEDIPREEI